MPYQVFANLVLVLHFGIVLFVILGLPVVVLGNNVGWTWVNGLKWRVAHLGAIGVVVLQAWLGRLCALTDLESWLREQAGQAGYTESFIENWLQRLLYYDVPLWLLTVGYTVFALLVAWAWWRFPPTPRSR